MAEEAEPTGPAEGDAAPAEVQAAPDAAPSKFVEKLRTETAAGGNPEIQDNEVLYLAGDCGGTTARFMLYAVDPVEPVKEKSLPPGRLIFEMKYPNIFFKSFDKILQKFFEDCDAAAGKALPKAKVAVLAIAGIVNNNTCRYTNLDWVVQGEELEETFGFERVEIINDFVAQGYGMLTLSDDEVQPLNDVTPRPGCPIVCTGAGTGLGTTFLTPGSGGEYMAYPSEGGHIEFAPRDPGSSELQSDLLKYLKIKVSGYSRVSVERVVSGTGICNTYEFLCWKFPDRVKHEVHSEFIRNPKDASIVVQNTAPGTLCEQALQIFASCYGAYCGSLAIMMMPMGGLYLTGGVTKRLQNFLQTDSSFMKSYLDKGRVSPVLADVPLLLVKSDDMGQRGARLRAVRLIKQEAAKMVHRGAAVFTEAVQANRAPVRRMTTAAIESLPAPRSVDPNAKLLATAIAEYQESSHYLEREARGFMD